MSHLIELAATASEAIRALNHRTITRTNLPVPEVGQLAGTLSEAADRVAQLLGHLTRNLDARAHSASLRLDWNGEQRFTDPAQAITTARTDLGTALHAAHALATALDNALETLSTIADYGHDH